MMDSPPKQDQTLESTRAPNRKEEIRHRRIPCSSLFMFLSTLGNMMLLSPCLLHSFNVCNMNISLAVGRLLWSEQTYVAVKKATGPQDALWHCQSATGSGTHLLRQLAQFHAKLQWVTGFGAL